jgi:membrane-bound lytic murein transglycosylase A
MIAVGRLPQHRSGLLAAVALGLLLGWSGEPGAATKPKESVPAIKAAAAAKAKKAKGPRGVNISNSQLEPVDWDKIDGWAEDDHLAAFAAYLASCKAIQRGAPATREARPMLAALYAACLRAVAANPTTAAEARAFFEASFRPVRISPIGVPDGFLTGYYEPIVAGTRTPTAEFSHPLYRRPANLLTGGRMLKAANFSEKKADDTKASDAKTDKQGGDKKAKARRGGKHKLVRFFDRAAIEDGALAGRKLEICYLKDPVDSFFIHIQGSVRVRLEDGTMMRLNYDAQNGHPYTAVGKFLIDRNIVTREEMSMERIRQWMNANPDEGRDLRRLNKSYVFFRETGLADHEEPIGAQGVSLTPGRSIAVDRNLHTYGTPFFISADLPIESEQPTTKFRRLMVAQDTGGAIIGPARADLYWGAGVEPGVISGRFKHPGKFVMLFPNEADPFRKLRDIPLPTPRPANLDAVAGKADKPPAQVAAKPAEAKKPDAKKPEGRKPDAKPPALASAKTKPATSSPAKPAEPKKTTAKKPEPKPEPAASKKPKQKS